MFGLGPDQISFVAPLVTDALVANYAGDEPAADIPTGAINGFIASGPPFDQLGFLLLGIWTDLYPADNSVSVPLTVSDNSVRGPGAPASTP